MAGDRETLDIPLDTGVVYSLSLVTKASYQLGVICVQWLLVTVACQLAMVVLHYIVVSVLPDGSYASTSLSLRIDCLTPVDNDMTHWGVIIGGLLGPLLLMQFGNRSVNFIGLAGVALHLIHVINSIGPLTSEQRLLDAGVGLQEGAAPAGQSGVAFVYAEQKELEKFGSRFIHNALNPPLLVKLLHGGGLLLLTAMFEAVVLSYPSKGRVLRSAKAAYTVTLFASVVSTFVGMGFARGAFSRFDAAIPPLVAALGCLIVAYAFFFWGVSTSEDLVRSDLSILASGYVSGMKENAREIWKWWRNWRTFLLLPAFLASTFFENNVFFIANSWPAGKVPYVTSDTVALIYWGVHFLSFAALLTLAEIARDKIAERNQTPASAMPIRIRRSRSETLHTPVPLPSITSETSDATKGPSCNQQRLAAFSVFIFIASVAFLQNYWYFGQMSPPVQAFSLKTGAPVKAETEAIWSLAAMLAGAAAAGSFKAFAFIVQAALSAGDMMLAVHWVCFEKICSSIMAIILANFNPTKVLVTCWACLFMSILPTYVILTSESTTGENDSDSDTQEQDRYRTLPEEEWRSRLHQFKLRA
eukprot:GHVU01113623.1.p1 GENE.GHVU01113623.1~~GHVU01113623.1.p1  ORF type:complete len:586 (+),score=43.73 GHVU01113623.1:939-2696(+)